MAAGGLPVEGEIAADFGAPAQMTANIASSSRAWAVALKIPAPCDVGAAAAIV